MRRLIVGGVAAVALNLAAAADPRRDEILAGYMAEARANLPGFSTFSAERGRALYFGPHAEGKPEACAACHTANPTAPGRHYRTGRDIEPMAVSSNPSRFTDSAEVEKRLARNCKNVLRRPCTTQEKGDFITFLLEQ